MIILFFFFLERRMAQSYIPSYYVEGYQGQIMKGFEHQSENIGFDWTVNNPYTFYSRALV